MISRFPFRLCNVQHAWYMVKTCELRGCTHNVSLKTQKARLDSKITGEVGKGPAIIVALNEDKEEDEKM